jgi:hypothetical protein
MVAADIATDRGLDGDLQTLLDPIGIDGPREIEPFPNTAGRREQLVDGS